MTTAVRPHTQPSPTPPVGLPTEPVGTPAGRAGAKKPGKLRRFYDATVGKKIVMAVTGLIWVGFLVVHMSGNLLAFAGRESLNNYARLLRTIPELLWIARIALVVALVLHVWSAIGLTVASRKARPAGYTTREPQVSTFASRTIRWGGLLILLFLVYHILHMTLGTVHPRFAHLMPYDNVVNGFTLQPLTAGIYTFMMIVVGLHLYHGTWASIRSLGVARPQMQPLKRRIATGLAIAVWLGFTTVPVAVLLGILRLP
jgi:succinate dehydrogenase / fumarate reductase, cytochrome b subunit